MATATLFTDTPNLAMEAVRSHPADLVVDAPPGSGKTSLLIDLVVLVSLMLGRRVLVAAVSNDQCDDITRRAAVMYPRLRIDRFVASGETRPRVLGLGNVQMIDNTNGLASPVIVASIEKLAQIENLGFVADQLFIDEAYQARRADYDRIRALAVKACLIGDPGQIRPIYQSDIRLYASDDRGPHVAAPIVLLKNGHAIHLQMRQSRRVPQDTVDIIQPSFYPGLAFTAAAGPGQRLLAAGARGMTPFDRQLDAALGKGSLSMIALPRKVVPRFDREVLDAAGALVGRLLARRFQFQDDQTSGNLGEADIGVVAFHRDQVTAIRQMVPAGVYVETANRFQGLERRVVVALHPMSGAERITNFRAEAGRACVALSRHRIACILVGRDGVLDVLDRAVPEDERHFGRADDPVYEGLRAHRTLMELIEGGGMIVRT